MGWLDLGPWQEWQKTSRTDLTMGDRYPGPGQNNLPNIPPPTPDHFEEYDGYNPYYDYEWPFDSPGDWERPFDTREEQRGER